MFQFLWVRNLGMASPGGSPSGSLGSLKSRWSWGYRSSEGSAGAGGATSKMPPSPGCWPEASLLCINHIFYLLCSDVLTPGVSLTPEVLPVHVWPPLRHSQHLSTCESVSQMQTKQCGAHLLSPALVGPHTLGHRPPALTTPEQGPNN